MICPTCKRTFTTTDPKTASDPESRRPLPFCSTRCRAADLGNWLDGNYRLTAPAGEEELDSGIDTDGDVN